MAPKNEDAVEVKKMQPKKGVTTGKPRKIITTSMRAAHTHKVAFPQTGNTMQGAGGNWYSPELSPDFLELPQSIEERRNYFRFFYENEPFVNQAVNLNTELPLSKIRLRKAKARNPKLAALSLAYCEKWGNRIGLLHRLIEIVHEYNLLGEVNIFTEDNNPEMPPEVRAQPIREVTAEGDIKEDWEEYDDANAREVAWLKKNYRGWTAIRVLPPEQVMMESFPFTDEKIIELVPDAKTRDIIDRAQQQDPVAMRIVGSMPEDIVYALLNGENIPLNMDQYAGSFVHYLARKKSPYEERGKSLLQSCLRTLVHRDKLRQAQASIASRHMTPYRLVYAEDMNEEQTEELREQVDLALKDPDYSIITNFQVTWEEQGADNRLLDLSGEYDLSDRQMYAGLGMTESLLSGESTYSGDRIHLEVINIRFMLLREVLQELVEEYWFKPMCARMGFVEEDEDGNLEIVYPRLSFTRLGLRDNSETFDALFNLYQKGSLDIDVILDLLNIDPVTTKEKLERDLFTVNDALFNELFRGLYSRVGDAIAENSDLAEKIAEKLGLQYKKAEEEGDGGRW